MLVDRTIPGTNFLAGENPMGILWGVFCFKRTRQPLDGYTPNCRRWINQDAGWLFFSAEVYRFNHNGFAIRAAGSCDVKIRIPLDRYLDQQGLVMARDHLLGVIGRHPPDHLRGIKELALIPKMIVLLVSLQAVGGAVDDHLAGQAFDHVDIVSMAQGALQVVA